MVLVMGPLVVPLVVPLLGPLVVPLVVPLVGPLVGPLVFACVVAGDIGVNVSAVVCDDPSVVFDVAVVDSDGPVVGIGDVPVILL